MAYLDYNATAPLRPEARAAMERAFALCGNASSVHAGGRAARALIEDARLHLAELVGSQGDDIVFTSGGAEANNLAIAGAIQGASESGARITRLFVSAIEHDSVLGCAVALGERSAGLRVETIPAEPSGVVALDELRRSLREGKGRALIAAMAANNETGVIQPLAEIAQVAKHGSALFFVDAVQACGKLPIDFGALGADYLSLSAHKLGGPQGAGALIAKQSAPFAPQILGGGQERGRRAGTENLSGIVGLGAAAQVAKATMNDQALVANLRDRFERRLKDLANDAVIFGLEAPRLANTSNFAIPGLASENSVMALDLDGVMISSGSACSSGKVRPSHVLDAMGVPHSLARCALRVSFGWDSSESDADAAISSLSKLRARVLARAAA